MVQYDDALEMLSASAQAVYKKHHEKLLRKYRSRVEGAHRRYSRDLERDIADRRKNSDIAWRTCGRPPRADFLDLVSREEVISLRRDMKLEIARIEFEKRLDGVLWSLIRDPKNRKEAV
jgi:hypothetical protein